MGRLTTVLGIALGVGLAGCQDDCEKWCGDWVDMLEDCHEDCLSSMEWGSGNFMCSEKPEEGHWPYGFGAEVPCSKSEFVTECRMQWNKHLDGLETTHQRETHLLNCRQAIGYEFDGDCCGTIGCCPPDWDDDDDQSQNDDDATAADDDEGDDDDSTPDYSGEIDIHHPDTILHSHCAATVESVPDGPTPEGWFEFEIELVGWARDCYVNLRDGTSDYCEAYDPVSGFPCEPYGYTRPGWDMANGSREWSEEAGFHDRWGVHIEYIMDLGQADTDGKSIFTCENAGSNFSTEFCCSDMISGGLQCAEFVW